MSFSGADSQNQVNLGYPNWRDVVHDATFLYRTIEREKNPLKQSGFGKFSNRR